MSLKMRKVSKNKKDPPLLEIYSDYHENQVIIDQEYDNVVIISAKGQIRTFPLPQ
jgi:hypothetical protein